MALFSVGVPQARILETQAPGCDWPDSRARWLQDEASSRS